MNAKTFAGCLVVVAVVAASAGPALGLINPNFTPIHLTQQSDAITIVKLKGKPAGDKVELETVKSLKGKAPAAMSIDLGSAAKQHADHARQALDGWAGREMALFSGKYDKEEVGYLHVRGMWFRLAEGGGGQWKLAHFDGDMAGTWAGGTDMLIRCVNYILTYGNEATVPVAAGTDWRGKPVKIAQLKGDKPAARNIAAVDLAGDGKCCLYVASTDGDLLLRPAPGKEAFDDLAAKAGLAAKSAASAWGDFDGDGRLDLLSFDGKTLTLWSQGEDGKFTSAKAGGSYSIPADCPGLETISLGENLPPSVVVGGTAPLAILKPAGRNVFNAAALAEVKSPPANMGKAQAPLVGDFNNDGLPDIIIPHERDGLLYAGKKGGGFEDPKPCGVNCTPGGGKAAVGDFDGDGWLDVLAAGAEGVRIFQNLHDGTFEESLAVSGEVAYKTQPFASWCGVCDFNNDGRVDMLLTYSNQAALLYFNRGFRSFGQAPRMELALGEIPGFEKGQQMGLFADLDGDAAQDLVLVMPDGSVWVAYNDFGEDAKAVRVRLAPKPPWAGPVNVQLWAGKRLLGAWPAQAGQPAFIGVPDSGKYQLKWQWPGGQELARPVTVEKGGVDVVLDKDAGAKPAATAPK